METRELTAVRGAEKRIYDLGSLYNGVIEAAPAAEADIEIHYGSYPDFMPFKAKMKRQGGKLASPILTLRYFSLEGDIDKIGQLSFKYQMKPLSQEGKIDADDPLIAQLSRVCNHTVHCCIMPHWCGNSTIHLQPQRSRDFVARWRGKNDDFVLFDGARRDREVWVGDLYYEVRACIFGFRDCESVRNSFDVILCQMREDGYIPGSSISMLEFPDYTGWFFIALAEYYMLSGDLRYLEENREKLKQVLHYMLSTLSEGMFRLPQGRTWAWTLARQGYITSSNCILYKALLSAKQIFEAAGDTSVDGEMLETFAKNVRARVNAEMFDAKAGGYLDAAGSDMYTLDANVLAVLFGVCKEKDRDRVLAFVREKFWTEHGSLLCWPKEKATPINHNHTEQVWPYINCLEIEARFLCGHTEEAEELVRRVYGNMLARGADTFWEFFDGKTGAFVTERMEKVEDDRDNYDSECHGWSAGIASVYLRYAAGLVPVRPGYAECSLRPDFMHYDRFDAVCPTAQGNIEIHMRRSESRAEILLRIPDGIILTWAGSGTLRNQDRKILAGGRIVSGTYEMDSVYCKKKEAEKHAVWSAGAGDRVGRSLAQREL